MQSHFVRRALAPAAILVLSFGAVTARAAPWFVDAAISGNVGFDSFSDEYNSMTSMPPGYTGATVADLTSYCSAISCASAAAVASLPEGLLGVLAHGSAVVPGESGSMLGIAQAMAEFDDTLTFSIPGASASSVTPAVFTIALGGPAQSPWNSYLQVSLTSATTNSQAILNGAFFSHNVVQSPEQNLVVDQVGTGTVGAGWTSYSIADSTPETVVFTGTTELFGASPEIEINAQLFAFADNGGLADFIDPATLTMTLPAGVTYTSASGVFLSQPFGTSVPEPPSAALLVTGILGLGFLRLRNRQRKIGAISAERRIA